MTIKLIAVGEKYTGQNIGKSLIRNLENYLYKKGVKTIKVGTQIDNIFATNFYIANGFKNILSVAQYIFIGHIKNKRCL